MKQHLAVSAIGGDRTGMVHELTRVISECGGNISESRMASLGTEFAMLLLVSGNWHALAKLETELARLPALRRSAEAKRDFYELELAGKTQAAQPAEQVASGR